MTKPLELEISNFVCRFGTSKVLIDLLEEIVLPAFFSDDARTYRDTEYFFLNPEFKYLKSHGIEFRTV